MYLSVKLSLFFVALTCSKVHGDPVATTIVIALNAGVVTYPMLSGLTTSQMLDKISDQLGNYVEFNYNFDGSSLSQMAAANADYEVKALAKMQTGDPTYALVGNALNAPNPFNPTGLAVIGIVNTVISGGETNTYNRVATEVIEYNGPDFQGVGFVGSHPVDCPGPCWS